MFGNGIHLAPTRPLHGPRRDALPAANLIADVTLAARQALTGRGDDVPSPRTRDELYIEARAIGIHGRGKMSKSELASAIERAKTPGRALTLLRAGRRRVNAIPARAGTALDSLARVRELPAGLILALSTIWRSHRVILVAVALLAMALGGGSPVLVFGMSTETAAQTPPAHAHGQVSGAPKARPKRSANEGEHSRRAHHPTASSRSQKANAALVVKQTSSSGTKATGTHATSAAALSESAPQPGHPHEHGRPGPPHEHRHPGNTDEHGQPGPPHEHAQPDKPHEDPKPDKPHDHAKPDKPHEDPKPDKPHEHAQPGQPHEHGPG
jgi:hypothetical protein